MGGQGQGRGPHGRKGPSAHQPREADRVTCALCLSVPTYGKRLLQLPTRGIFYAASLGRGEGQLLPVVCTRHHVLLIDELDAVDGAPEKGAVRGMAQPHPQPTLPPTLGRAGRLTGGHRRQAGTPRGSSTHARSRPGPRRSHSTPCSEHPVRPQRPGARSWSRGQMDDEVTHEPEHTRVHALSRAHLQRLHIGVLCHIPHLHRAVVGCAVELVGASAECQPLGVHGKREEGDLGYSRRDRGQAQGAPSRVLCGALRGDRGTLTCPCQAGTDSLEAASSLGKLASVSPSSSPSLPCFCPIHRHAGSMRMRTLCLIHAIPWSQAPSLAHSGA